MKLTVKVEGRSRRYDFYDIDIPDGGEFDPEDPRDVEHVLEKGVLLKTEYEEMDIDTEDMDATIVSGRLECAS